MKQVVFLLKSTCLAGALAFAGCSKEEKVVPPPHAATTQTWSLDGKTWSDAIQMPDCNKESFEESETEPQGRSYRSGGKTYYYYNWAYVNANKNTMCPSPWRVPTRQDFERLYNLDMDAHQQATFEEWGLGGYITDGSVHDASSSAYFWSSSADAYYYCYFYGDHAENLSYPDGLQVRCVRDH
ncbi:MAG: hypothetical protein LBK12_05095 [Odoribacteraceae bacterium]|jgi:hypothetical protein|nr:hypothetical protein [Odoribacteraceae bacterium]